VKVGDLVKIRSNGKCCLVTKVYGTKKCTIYVCLDRMSSNHFFRPSDVELINATR